MQELTLKSAPYAVIKMQIGYKCNTTTYITHKLMPPPAYTYSIPSINRKTVKTH